MTKAMILVVDDDRTVRDVLREMLLAAGYAVLAAGSGREALSLCAQHGDAIDALVADIQMPGMNGVELGRQAAALFPGIKVLYISGFMDLPLVRHVLSDPWQAFLAKPFQAGELARRVRELLDGAPRP